MIKSLANSYIFSLLEDRSKIINFALLSELESELPLYFIMQVDCLRLSFIAFAVTEVKYVIVRLFLATVNF